MFSVSADNAFQYGTNIKTALRIEPERTRAAVLAMIRRVCEFVDAKRTLTTIDDYLLTSEAIFTEHPTLTLEEMRLVAQDMMMGKHGKFYERLKTAEFLEAMRTHETGRAAILERINRAPATRGLREGQKVEYEPQSMADLMRKRSRLLTVSEKEQRQKDRDAKT